MLIHANSSVGMNIKKNAFLDKPVVQKLEKLGDKIIDNFKK